ncbi:MAG: FecR family protein [Methyloglobulus sp.]|nr:FecR family protein [Methyloglobulus sp.]
MQQPVDPKTLQQASSQASEWFVLLNSGKATTKQKLDFEHWLVQSSDHHNAWQQTQSLWQGLEQLSPADIKALKNTLLPAASSTRNEVNLRNAKPSPSGEGEGVKSTRPRFFTPTHYAFGAMILLLAALICQQPFWYADYYTGAGESKRISLNDGSTVELDSGSAISVDYTANRRRLVLHQGEAFFTVAADAARPFDVVAGEAEVRALGTAFDVSREGENMQVTVFEHAVRVSAGMQRIDKLSSGNSVSFKDKHLGNITPQNLTTINSWRQHRLIFADQRLGDVVKALNRYRRLPIIILGSQAKNLSVTGLFDTQDTDTALQTIEETLAVNIRRLPGGLVLLTGI